MRAEVRGRGRKWRVFYEDPSGIASPILMYDKDGVLKGTLWCGAPSNKMIESAFVAGSLEEATEYARWLGATEVTVRKTATKEEALVKARAVRNRQKEDDE